MVKIESADMGNFLRPSQLYRRQFSQEDAACKNISSSQRIFLDVA